MLHLHLESTLEPEPAFTLAEPWARPSRRPGNLAQPSEPAEDAVTEPDPFWQPPGAPPAGPPAPTPYGPMPAAPAWYGPAYTPAPLPRAPWGLGVAAIVIAAVWTWMQVLALLVSSSAAETYGLAARSGLSSRDVYTAYDAVGALSLPVQIAAFVVGCLWLSGSRRLAEAATPQVRHQRGAVWVWLGWVVPIVSLWFPLQVVRDVAAGTRVDQRLRGVLGWWWASWLLASWASNVASRLPSGVGGIGPSALVGFEVVATGFTIAAFVLWVRIITVIRDGQRVLTQGRG